MSLTSFFLVIFESEKPRTQRAGWTYLVATHLGTALLLAMFALLGSRTGATGGLSASAGNAAGATGGSSASAGNVGGAGWQAARGTRPSKLDGALASPAVTSPPSRSQPAFLAAATPGFRFFRVFHRPGQAHP